MSKVFNKMKVSRVSLVAFEGAEIPGGKTVARDEFVKMRTARLSVQGVLDDGNEEVEILFTRKKESAGEFAALTDMIGKRGVLEGTFTNLRKKEKINGTTTLLRMPRIDLVTTDDQGEKAFSFTETAKPKWAASYGSTDPEMINFGSSEKGKAKLQELRDRPKDDELDI